MLNNFIYTKYKSLFEEALNNGEVLDEAIVFIEDTKLIWNHGTYFDCNDKHITEENLNEVLSEYITETALNLKGYLTEHLDLSKLALKSEIPDLNGYATEEYVNQEISKIPSSGEPLITDVKVNGESVLTDKVANIDLSSYATEQWVTDKGYLTEHQDISLLALKSELPTKTSDLENDSEYVTEERVEEMIEGVVIESGGVVVDNEIDADSSNPVTNEAIARALEAAVARGRELAKRDLYIAAGAEYNDTDSVIKKTAFWGAEVDHLPHHYYLNGLGDITEEQMERIYQFKDSMTTFIASGSQGGRFWQGLGDEMPRTLFGTNNRSQWVTDKSISSNSPFASTQIEVVKWTNAQSLSPAALQTNGLFVTNSKLRVVDRFSINKDFEFYSCPNLEEFRFWAVNFNVILSTNPKISKESIVYTIANVLKTTTKALVITLHPNVYAKCIEGGEWQEEVQSALDTANAAITGGGSINIASA